jgi:poly-gamma-glutamate capsule biosynthesis protein CapA/YwtB (metallophosphatase superfamily)
VVKRQVALKESLAALAARLVAALITLALAACANSSLAATLPPVTRVTIARTATPSSAPATATRSPTATNTSPPSPTLTPLPPTTTAPPSATVPPVVRFMAVGDLMLGRSVGERIQAVGPDVVFSGVAATLGQADLLAGNLECVISDQGQPQAKSYTFRAPLAAIKSLAATGFDVLSVANNHSMDYGPAGLADMLARLRDAGLSSVGAGADAEAARAPVLLERNGVHIAFLAYVNVPVEGRTNFDTRIWAADVARPGVAWAEPQVIAHDVASAKTLADVVVVLLHVGLEGRVEVNSIQRALAHAAVDAGASLVIGSHSHTLQPVERYKDAIIAYGLGNFVFDDFTIPSNYSAIFTATLTPHGVDSYSWVPVVVVNGLPRLATSDEAAVILPLVREQ